MLPYTYVPGRFPHPLSHPDGHRFQGKILNSSRLDPRAWQECDAYGYGIELFNHGYYWEAHEVWEGCWNEAGRTGPLADFLKALIKLAAAMVKAREGRAAGVVRHATRSRQLLDSVESGYGTNRVAGLDLNELRGLAHQLSSQSDHLTALAGAEPEDAVNAIANLRIVTLET